MKITIPILLVAVIVYALLRYANAANQQVVDLVLGFITGLSIGIVGNWISILFKKKKKITSPGEEKKQTTSSIK